MDNIDFNKLPPPQFYVDFLYKIYHCKVPFELRYRKTKPKHYIGLYVVQPHRINLYPRWTNAQKMKEVAIHEYAHHIHHTEHFTGNKRGVDRMHGEKFWRIYSVLMAKAMRLGLYHDDLIEDILKD